MVECFFNLQAILYRMDITNLLLKFHRITTKVNVCCFQMIWGFARFEVYPFQCLFH